MKRSGILGIGLVVAVFLLVLRLAILCGANTENVYVIFVPMLLAVLMGIFLVCTVVYCASRMRARMFVANMRSEKTYNVSLLAVAACWLTSVTALYNIIPALQDISMLIGIIIVGLVVCIVLVAAIFVAVGWKKTEGTPAGG